MFCIRHAAPFALLAAALITVPALGQEDENEKRARDAREAAEKKAKENEAAERKNPAEAPSPAGKQVLRLYEWGVETMRWDGGAEPEFDDVPARYYEPSEVKVEATRPPEKDKPEPPKPKPDPGPAKPRKPVIYFDCDVDVTFDLDVRFTKGKATWMYPKPSRMVDATTVQWDNIMLFSDKVTARDASPDKADMANIEPGHWANYSRSGSTSTLVVNGETERFVFYEGETHALPEVDCFSNAEGQIVIRNYSSRAIYSVRFTQTTGATTKAWLASSVPAANGDTPGEITLGSEHEQNWEKFAAPGVLTTETQAAGLTGRQAKVFDRAWRDAFFKKEVATLSYRRDAQQLDDLMELKLTLPEGFGLEQKRVGYVFIHGIDLSRQTEIEKLAASAAAGSADDTAKLKKLGMAAIGALRRQMNDMSLPLKSRVAASKLLGEFAR